MKPEPKIRATPRNIRVAFILEDGVDSHEWLDAIISECFSRDGGKHSLIVPLINGDISKRFQDWLRLFDPDFIELITYDNEAVARKLITLLSDTVLLNHRRIRGELEPNPRVSIERSSGLTSLSWLPFLKTVSGYVHSPPTHILDCYPAWKDDGLIKDNFGTLHGSANSFPIHQQLGIRGLILTPENPPENRWRFRSVEADEVQDAYVVLENLGNQAGIVTLGQLSNLCAQPHNYRHPWAEGFCLVVGDSFEDRVSCWNAGLLFGGAQNQRYKTLRVPSVAALATDKAIKIGAFLRSCNWIGGNNGPSRVVVRSHSLNHAQLEDFITQIIAFSKSNVTFSAITSVEECCPSNSVQRSLSYGFENSRPVTVETAITRSQMAVTAPQPTQMTYCSGMHPIFSQGYWHVDLSIDRINDVGRFCNVREPWMLPNRQQLVRHFSVADGARIRRDGSISVLANMSTVHLEVSQPDDTIIFRSLFTDRPFFSNADMRSNLASESFYRYVEPSDKGSYLEGLIGMFGSLSDIENTMNSHFWRTQFNDLASPAQSQHEEVIRDIQRRMGARSGKLLIEDNETWQKLAQRIIQKASRLKVPRQKTRYDLLLAAWTTELTDAIRNDEYLGKQRDEILAEREHKLKHSLSYLFERGIFFRGHEWSCRQCRHRNWRGVEALKELMECEVCRHEHQLPVNVELNFRMNEFFATCLREHDTITVAWAISALRHQARTSFMYAPQTALYHNYPENQCERIDRELDLICIVDGKFVIGEVKARVDLIAKSDIKDLADAVQEVGADVAVLAAMTGDKVVMESKLQELQALLPTEIEAKYLIADWDDKPSIYL